MVDSRKKFEYARSPYSNIKKSTLAYIPSERIIFLSKPKVKKENLIRTGRINSSNLKNFI